MEKETKRNRNGQFVSGQSGNPEGRPRGKRKNWDQISKLLSEPVPVRRPDGTYENLKRLDISFRALCSKALKGDNKSLFKALDIMQKLTPPDEAEPEHANFKEPDYGEIPVLGEIMEIRHELPKDMAPIDLLGIVIFGAEIARELEEEARAEAKARNPSG